MRLPKVRELVEAIRAIFVGPYTSPFPREMPQPHRNFRGQPQFDPEKCVGCLGCEEICPVGAIDHRDDLDREGGTPMRVMIHYTDTCIFCGECEAACINDHQGIVLTDEWELSFFDRSEACETIEKELVLCECCGEPVACRDHLIWISDRLAELTFSNPTLYLTKMRELGVADENLVRTAMEGWRPDRMKVLCARCRRQTTLTTAEDS